MSNKNLALPDRPHSQRENQLNSNKRNSQKAMKLNTEKARKIGNLLPVNRLRTEMNKKEIEETKQIEAPAELLKQSFSLATSLPEPEFPPNNPDNEAGTPINYPIIIFFETGNVLQLKVNAASTVTYIKNEIWKRELIPTDRQSLKFSGRQLIDNETMSKIHAHRGSMLNFYLISNSNRQAPQMPRNLRGNQSENCLIHLETTERQTSELYVDLAESVKSLKIKIMDANGILPIDQRLILNGQELREIDRSLESYGVQNGSKIHLIAMRRGC